MAPGAERTQVIKVRDTEAVLTAKGLTIHPDLVSHKQRSKKRDTCLSFHLAGMTMVRSYQAGPV